MQVQPRCLRLVVCLSNLVADLLEAPQKVAFQLARWKREGVGSNFELKQSCYLSCFTLKTGIQVACCFKASRVSHPIVCHPQTIDQAISRGQCRQPTFRLLL